MSTENISSLSSILNLAQEKMSLGFGLIFLIFGVTGNFLNILLFPRRQFRTVSCCTYFLAASVTMFISVSISGGTITYAAYYKNPINNILIYCKIWFYIQQATLMMSRWMLTVACLDRYALLSTNVRLRRFANIKIARRVVVAIVLIWIVLPIPLLVLYNLKANHCIITYSYAAVLFDGIFSLINACGIPIPIMITCTLLIQQNLANRRKWRQSIINHQQQRENNIGHVQRKRDQQAFTMLVIQIIVYIVLTIPWVVYGIYSAISFNVTNKSSDRLALERFIYVLTGSILLLFASASFYLYTLTSSMFRKELFIMLRSIFLWKCFINNRRRIDPIAINAS